MLEIDGIEEVEKNSILYVDDEESNLRIFRTAFKRDYKILLANSGSEAIEILKNNKVDLIITDQKMPEMTGTELLERILPEFPNVIRIILTGFADVEAIIQAVNKCGIYKYITKPWDRGELKLTLDQALESFQLKNDNQSLVAELKNMNEGLEIMVKERTLKLENANRQILDSIRYAQKIQNAMLSSTENIASKFKDYFGFYLPKDIVGGDFYWFGENKEKIVIAAADCTGHGVPGAMMSMIGDALLNEALKMDLESPEQFLVHLQEGVYLHLNQGETDSRDGMDVGIAIVDMAHKKIVFSGARQSLIVIHNGEIFQYKGDNIAVGGQEKSDRLFTTYEVQCYEGDAFYMFSDGYQDQFGGLEDRKFSSARLRELLLQISEQPMVEQLNVVKATFKDWLGIGKQLDDVMIMGFRF
jgi:phosphoserine phosphatase RsbU/P